MGDIRNEIRSYIVARGFTITEIVREWNQRNPENQTTPQNLGNKLARGTIRYSECKEIADIIGLKIVWQETGK